MKKLLTLCVFTVLFAGIFAGTPNKAKVERGVTSIPKNAVEATYQNTTVRNVAINPAVVTPNAIVTGITNIRTLLGGGTHIVKDAAGNIHVTGLQGSADTYSLFYSVSDDASTFNNFTGIGLNAGGGRDRYPAIAVKGTAVNIAFHNQISGTGHVAMNPDPLGGGSFTLTGELTNTPSCWLSMIYPDATTNNIYATWVETNGTWPTLVVNVAKSTDGGASWLNMGMLPDSNFNVNSGYGPSNNPIMAEGNYVITQLWSDDSLLLVGNYGFDPDILNNMDANYSAVPLYCESTDGGQTWLPAQLQFGPNKTDYPTAKVLVDGVLRNVRTGGGAYWPSASQGFIKNGIVYMVTPSITMDWDNAGFASGIEVVILSTKPVGVGGTWTHKVISGDAVIYGTSQVYGYARYGELSMREGDPNRLILVYNDISRPTHQIAITGSNDGGLTWVTDTTNMIFIDQVADMGFATAAGMYLHTSPVFTTDNSVDITFITGADGAITNGTQYHVRVDVSSIIGVGENPVAVKDFKLSQNYPNPFNPSTTISYDIKGAQNVTLKIYNTLGQEVKTLVNTRQNAGNYKVQWDGKDNAGKSVASGVYIYRLEAGDRKSVV